MKADNLAQYIIKYYRNKELIISNLILQKLLYLIQNALLVNGVDEEYLIDENFEAWVFGPVIRELYKKYSVYGALNISIALENDKIETIERLPKKSLKIINYVIDKYLYKRAWDLVDLTHISGNAWDKTMKEIGDGYIIPKKYIRLDDYDNRL